MEQNLSLRQFFHGTNAAFKPGELIHPNYHTPMGVGSGSDFVWSTPKIDDARMYGRNIYEVEPTGLHAPYKMHVVSYRGRNIEQHVDDSRWVSMAPMRVVRRAR